MEQIGLNITEAAQRGGMTLVIGAGVSIPRGVPNWNDLAEAMWEKAFGKHASPWSSHSRFSRQVSQFLPITFELAYRTLGAGKFVDALRENMYRKVKHPAHDKNFNKSNESLAVIARLLFQEYHREASRRIDAVITLNADDLIEQAVNAVAGASGNLSIFYSVARGTHWNIGGTAKRLIPIYHIHGYLPSTESQSLFNYMLVFTDVQYWSTSASALSFANRIMASALSESRCIFIGLSMTDINLLRWLALRTIEWDIDMSEFSRSTGMNMKPAIRSAQERIFARHFWIRPASDDPGGFLSRFLEKRGINTVPISGWKGDAFQDLILKCFPRWTKIEE